jgi:hypothetical protein
MNVRRAFKSCMVAALAAIGMGLGLDKAVVAQQGAADVDPGVEVLTRGPVHEAFAETVTFNPEPGIIVPKAPPDPIEEMPPEEKPQGDNVTWIPGYWAWDDEQRDFLWVSGIWRALPPDRQWVPGYWAKSQQGFQWISGYWADAEVSEIEYLPEPPETVEAGPNIKAPSADDLWIPGCWVWNRGRYAWRPGYWATGRPDWDWIPAHYVYAPRGYVFVDGYWDYSVGRRGVLFAPVHFQKGVYTRRGFSYSPRIVIDLRTFADHLFLRPRYQHYYFGDYYAPSYHDAGFRPAFSYNSSRYGYDPIYAHQRWDHRQDRDWDHKVQAQFQRRRDHEDERPPRTLAAQIAFTKSAVTSAKRGLMVAARLDQLAKRNDTGMRFQPVVKEERHTLARRGQEVQKFRQQRQKLETTAVHRSEEKASRQSEPARVKFPKSPIVASRANKLAKDQVPPKRQQAPQPDLKVQPKHTKAVARSEPPRAESRDKPRGGSKDKDKDNDRSKDK